MRVIQVFAIGLTLYFSFGTNNRLYAQEKDSKPAHHDNHYHLSAFTGFTTNYKGKNGYKIGIEYEYRLSEYVGIGGAFDFTGVDFEIFALSAGADFYPFKFPLIPGIMVGAKYAHSEWKPFIRAMLLYDFHIGRFSLGPMIMYDIFSGEKDIMSYGITVGYSLN